MSALPRRDFLEAAIGGFCYLGGACPALLIAAIPVRGVLYFKRRFFKVRMAHSLVAGGAFFLCPVNEMDYGENAGDDRQRCQ